MGRSVVASVVVAAAGLACSSPRGMLVGFQASTAATAVEVFLGDTQVTAGDGGDCPGGPCRVLPPMAVDADRIELRGSGWTTRLPISTFATIDHDSIGWIELDRSPGEDAALAVIAVEYDGDVPARAAANDELAIEPGTVVEIPLEPATVGGTGDGLHVDVWRQPGDTARTLPACVAVGTEQDQFQFIVPAGDKACDGPAKKCVDTTWDYCGTSAVSVAASTCVTATTTGACRIGGTGCVDTGSACTSPPPPACAPGESVACLVPEVCGECNTWDASCLVPAPNDTVPYIDCPLQIALGIGSGSASSTPCGGGAAIPASVIQQFIGSAACGDLFLMPQQDMVGSAMTIPVFGDGSMVTMISVPGTCTATLEVVPSAITGTSVPSGTTTATLGVPVAGGAETLLIPLVIEADDCIAGQPPPPCSAVFPPPQGSGSAYNFPCP